MTVNTLETGNNIPPEVVASVFRDNPNLKGYKDSTQDVIHLQTVMSLLGKERPIELMAGSDAQIYATWMLGGQGVISLITCVFPQLIVEICDALKVAMTQIEYTGVTAKGMTWSANGEPTKPPIVVKIENGAYTIL